MSQSPRFLHVANGTSTTATIEAAGLPGRCSIWADPLHDGPVPADLADPELIRVRGGVLADLPEHPAAEVEADLHRWRAVIVNTTDYDELVLWYEHDLFDQLNLIQLLDWLRRCEAPPAHVSLICIGSFPGRPAFKGLGELTPVELAPLLDTREPIRPEQYELASRAWSAFREPDPRTLAAFTAPSVSSVTSLDTSALPFLTPALRRHLEEFPSSRDGLSRSERRLLTLLDRGPMDVWTVFPRMHDGETAFYIADGSFVDLVESLAAGAAPLVSLDRGASTATDRLRGTLSLTDVGRDVLAGRDDRVRRCGIDRWLGGVRLEGHGPVWRRSENGDGILFSLS
jgi:hypothetical protein